MGAVRNLAIEAQQEAERYLLQGNYYYEQRNYRKALENYAASLTKYAYYLYWTEKLDADLLGTTHYSIVTQTNLLFTLAVQTNRIAFCYYRLREPRKVAVFVKQSQKIFALLTQYQACFNLEQRKNYPEISKEVDLLAYTKGTQLAISEQQEASPLTDISDETYQKIRQAFEKIFSLDICLLESNQKNSSCFIATAVYSTSNHPDLDTFREFRDQIMLSNSLGKLLMGIYYKLSPNIAKYVSTKPVLKNLLRPPLERLALWMRYHKKSHANY